MTDNLIKVAYGIGCLDVLNSINLPVDDFIKAAAASNDVNVKNAADAICAVIHFAETEAATTEKVAAAILTPQYTQVKTALFEGKDYAERMGQGAGVGAGIGGGLGALGLGIPAALAGAAEAGHAGGPNAARKAAIGGLLAGLLGGAVGGAGGAISGLAPGALGGLAYEGLREPTLKERLGLG